jgi:putative flippase GtrA
MPYELAIVFAFITGMALAFSLMRFLVFNSREKSIQQQLPAFILINLLALVQTVVVSVVFARWILPAIGVIQKAQAIGHGIGVLVPVVTSYIGHKRLTFK